MFNPVTQMVRFLRARWRWARGRCSLCNRHLYPVSRHFVADHPGCLLCKEATESELRMGLWGGLADFPAEESVLSDPECPRVGADQFVAGRREQEVERCRSGSPTSGASGGA